MDTPLSFLFPCNKGQEGMVDRLRRIGLPRSLIELLPGTRVAASAFAISSGIRLRLLSKARFERKISEENVFLCVVEPVPNKGVLRKFAVPAFPKCRELLDFESEIGGENSQKTFLLAKRAVCYRERARRIQARASLMS